eukprot:12420148-Karenia_brevis.AAC.1
MGKYVFEDRMESNPWLDQMYHDIQHLEGMDSIYEVCEWLQDMYQERGALALKDFLSSEGEEYREIFIGFDMQQLKAKH